MGSTGDHPGRDDTVRVERPTKRYGVAKRYAEVVANDRLSFNAAVIVGMTVSLVLVDRAWFIQEYLRPSPVSAPSPAATVPERGLSHLAGHSPVDAPER